MSRYEIPALENDLSIVVGWDNPLQTFFTQVTRPSVSEDDDDHMLLWVGTEPREVITVDDLAQHLAPFADLSPKIVDQLRLDRAAKLGNAPTTTQHELLSIIRRAR